MKTPDHTTSRRRFLRQGALAGGSLLFLADHARGAAEPATDATNATLDTIHRARTTHGNFTAQEIPEDVLQKIIHASLRAPGASNLQNYSIIVVRERDRMKHLCGYAGSRALVYCIDYNRLTATAEHLGHAYKPYGLDSLLIGCVNTTLAIQNATLAARSLGVDYLVTNGVHRGDMTRVWKTLDLPESLCFPLAAVVLGYPTEEPKHQRGRLSGPGVVHENTYHRLTQVELDALVAQHDDPAQNLPLSDEWKKSGHKHYLDWLFTAWLGRGAPPAGQESQVTRLLKRSGFVAAAPS
ncbi:MAG TPA: nitroreductase family protein [Lacunisphaera sp.]|nr:nitroreductase family protein [Lacunisphaera sp.]